MEVVLLTYGVFTIDTLRACASLPHARLAGARGCPSVAQSAPALVLSTSGLLRAGKPGENRKKGGASEFVHGEEKRNTYRGIGDTQCSASRTTHHLSPTGSPVHPQSCAAPSSSCRGGSVLY